MLAIITAAAMTVTLQDATVRLSDASTQAILSGCFDYATENDLSVAITVMDDRLTLMGFRRMDGLRQGPADLSMRKAEYSASWGAATKGLADRVAEGDLGWALTSGGTPIEGGVPVYAQDGVLLGGIGVSGAPAAEDAKCARAGIEKAGLKDSRS